MTRLTLELANNIIEATFAEGAARKFNPLTVIVTDAGGHVIALQRQDRSSIMRPQIAMAKASGALGLGIASRKIGDMAAERPTFVASLGPVSPHGVVPAAGGVIMVDDDGYPIGAVGVTGDTSDNDEHCALVAIAAVGLAAQG